MLKFGKKGQFGPDAFIGLLLVAILGIGGIFLINLFVNSMSLRGMISIMDSEFDEKCFYTLNSLQGTEYIKYGVDIRGTDFQNTWDYMGGYRENMEYSEPFSEEMSEYSDLVSGSTFKMIRNVDAFIATERKAPDLRRKIQEEWCGNYVITTYCFVPVYSPVGTPGFAELFMSTIGGDD
ncbi:MAG TPA: hypothetical protein ENN30_01770 [Candidatus Woesearchaeota archaeon]|nr:hypothetical protein [Candidatus Woesearchaeota archaeon]